MIVLSLITLISHSYLHWLTDVFFFLFDHYMSIESSDSTLIPHHNMLLFLLHNLTLVFMLEFMGCNQLLVSVFNKNRLML